ncbi:interleukin-1 receptor-associated kinase 4-like [Lytechinus pictus]|uniref:interleukin-1 receptor-associated kinase 4-like n=1 Tax=Lytechinus pictus TaxID=7653 RepID=UPI0030B9B99E
MNITRETFVRELPLSARKRLALCLDSPLSNLDWRAMAEKLPRRPGILLEPKYNYQQISMFELALQRPGGSPTIAVLDDWGTTNARVADLLNVFGEMKHLAAMDALIPGSSVYYTQDEQVAAEAQMPPLLPSAPPMTPSIPPNIPPRPGASTVVAKPVYPADSTMLPCFDPETVQRFSYEEITRMTRGFDQKKVKDGGCLIDEGGFGVVYRGTFSGEEMCAVKKLKENVMPDEVSIEGQFDGELKALCRLRHPNLVILYGYCFEPPHLCLVYELIRGGSLRDRLACKDGTPTRKPLSWPKRLDIAWGSACGLRYLHDKGFIHRDIKSANILLDTNLIPKICDFGLVRDKSGKQKGEASYFVTSFTIGSTFYMAPEANFGEYSKKTDIYSFGLVLLEILTGLPVYDETHIMTTVDDIMDRHNDVVFLIDKHAEMWNERSAQVMYDLSSQCTEHKSRKRPDIEEVVQRLEGMQEETPTK